MESRHRSWRPVAALLAGFGVAAAVAGGTGGVRGARADDAPVSTPQKVVRRTAEEESERILAAAAASRSIDREIGKALLAEGITPTGPSDDAEFLRRVTLDLIGAPPTEGEVKAFLASKDAAKRSAKIEELLASPLFGDRMGDLWGRLLFSGIKKYPLPEVQKVFTWVSEGFNDGKGMDWLVREVVTATGNTYDNPALAYTLRFRDGGIPADIAGTTSRIFLGVQIQCAQCHDHPYEPWKQGEFASFAAFFNLVNPRPADPMDKKAGFVVEDPPMRALMRANGRGGVGADIKGAAKAEPKFLGGAVYKDHEGATRRQALAEWILDRKNPWFAKAMVNRVWSWYFGRGIVNPVDDFRTDSMPSHPALLDTLSLGFAESGYDLRFLARAITMSEAYQRTSRLPKEMQKEAKRGKEDDAAVEKFDKFYARGPIKPLTADQVFDSVLRITGMDDAFRRLNRAEIDRAKIFLLQQFVSEIDDDEMGSAEQWAGTIPQGLLLMNGPLTQVGTRASAAAAGRGDRLSILARENTLHRILDDSKDAGTRVDRIYLVALGRRPTDHEASEAAVFAARGKPGQGWEDLFWALINCSEFMSNH